MSFQSILFNEEKTGQKELFHPDDFTFFSDLNLDQVIETILSGKEEYNLRPFYDAYINNLETILYRQEIVRDLENQTLRMVLDVFAADMRKMREQLPANEKLFYKNQQERQFLDIVNLYCESVSNLSQNLSSFPLKSSGLKRFLEFLKSYIQSSSFQTLSDLTQKIIEELSTVKYSIHIDGLKVQVRKYEEETDYSEEVAKTFSKFKESDAKDHSAKLDRFPQLNQIEAQILEGVARLYPEVFSQMHLFYKAQQDFADETIKRFDREIQFYISYLDFIAPLKSAGLKFCMPEISSESKEIYDYEGFDLALAPRLIAEKSDVIVNDLYLKGKERMIIVSGPNQGGKTTFARSFGQMHYLAGMGFPVPGREARLFHPDKILTHFEKEENINNLRGKLKDELYRIHEILKEITPNSLLIINEIFTSTTLSDQISLSQKIMKKIDALDIVGVWVTFIDELASFNEKTVSMVSSVVPDNPATRTFKIERSPADGVAYALSIAEKYKLTYRDLKNRIKS